MAADTATNRVQQAALGHVQYLVWQLVVRPAQGVTGNFMGNTVFVLGLNFLPG